MNFLRIIKSKSFHHYSLKTALIQLDSIQHNLLMPDGQSYVLFISSPDFEVDKQKLYL